MTVSIRLENNQIHAQMIEDTPGVQFAFGLYYFENQRDQKNCLAETKYSFKKEASFEAPKTGYYFVRGYALKINGKKVYRESNSVLYLAPDVRAEFEAAMDSDLHTPNTINGPIDYFKVPDPQNDFCLIPLKDESSFQFKELHSWCDPHGFALQKLPHDGWNTSNYLLYDKSGVQKGWNEENNFLFSGYVWNSHKKHDDKKHRFVHSNHSHSNYPIYPLF